MENIKEIEIKFKIVRAISGKWSAVDEMGKLVNS